MSASSRGYIAVEHELLEANISKAALVLMLQLRKGSALRETDGAIDPRSLAAAAAYAGLSAGSAKKAVAELLAHEILTAAADGTYQDVQFLVWNTSRERREQTRADARRRKQRQRANERADAPSQVTAEVTRDVTRVSRSIQEQEQVQVQVQEQNRPSLSVVSLAPKLAVSPRGDEVTAKLKRNLTKERAEQIAAHWSSLTGKPTSHRAAMATADFNVSMPELLKTLDLCHGAGVYSLEGCRMTLQRLESEVRKMSDSERSGRTSISEAIGTLVASA